MCTEYSTETKCDHKKDCKLLGILRENRQLKEKLRENRQLKEKLRETKKELSDLQIRKSWEDYPEMMGR